MLSVALALAATVIPSIVTIAPRPTGVPTAAAPTEQAGPAGGKAAAQRYCVQSTLTGSRIPRRECRTRAEWLRDGFDPLARN